MALVDVRYPDKPLIEEALRRPTLTAQKFAAPALSKVPRRLRTLNLGDPGANADYPTQTIPSKSAWILAGFAGTLLCDATAVNRGFHIDIADIEGNIWGGSNSFWSAGANQTVIVRGIRGGTVSDQFNVGGLGASTISAIGLPTLPIPSGYSVQFITTGRQAGDNWGQGFLGVEEFTLPRGLAAGELPIGLESGFTWDLAEVRKVTEG